MKLYLYTIIMICVIGVSKLEAAGIVKKDYKKQTIEYQFLKAVAVGDEGFVRQALASNVLTEIVPVGTDKTPLVIAVLKNHDAIFQLLITYGANAYVRFQHGEKKEWTILHLAVQLGRYHMLGYLIQNNVLSMDVEDRLKITPLMVAAGLNNHEKIDGRKIFQLLLANRADVNKEDALERTPLAIALSKENYLIVWDLLCHKSLNLCEFSGHGKQFLLLWSAGYPISFFLKHLGHGALDIRCGVPLLKLMLQQHIKNSNKSFVDEVKIVLNYLLSLLLNTGNFEDYLNEFLPGSSQIKAIRGALWALEDLLTEYSKLLMIILDDILKEDNWLELFLEHIVDENDNEIDVLINRIRYHLLGLQDRTHIMVGGGRGAHRRLDVVIENGVLEEFTGLGDLTGPQNITRGRVHQEASEIAVVIETVS